MVAIVFAVLYCRNRSHRRIDRVTRSDPHAHNFTVDHPSFPLDQLQVEPLTYSPEAHATRLSYSKSASDLRSSTGVSWPPSVSRTLDASTSTVIDPRLTEQQAVIAHSLLRDDVPVSTVSSWVQGILRERAPNGGAVAEIG